MSWFSEVLRRVWSCFNREAIDRDLSAEMDFHLEMKAQKFQRQGLNASEARSQAHQQFGNVTQLHESGREAWGWVTAEQLVQDIRITLRGIRRSAWFTTASVLTLAIGIGSTVAVFGIVNAVILRPFPYNNAERLLIAPISVPDFVDLKASASTLEDLSIWASNLYPVRFGDDIEQVQGAIVSERFFPMLGSAELGRTLSSDDAYQPVVVISHRLWRTRFGANPAALGKTLTLNNEPYTIIGVMPDEFQFPSATFQLWVPFEHAMLATPIEVQNRAFRIFRTVARMKPGVSREQSVAEAQGISVRLSKVYPDTNAGSVIRFSPLREWMLGDVRTGLTMLMATAVLVLMIACANVANLMLSRAVARRREFGVRVSLGAGRMRLIRQNLTESLVLSLTGGVLAVGLGYAVLDTMRRATITSLPRISTATLDGSVLLFAFGLCCAATVVFGIAPALRASRANLVPALHDGGRASSTGATGNRLQRFIVAAEIVLACVVVVGAGLLAKSFSRLLTVDSGFIPDNLLTLNIGLTSYKDPARRSIAISQVLDNLSRVRGVLYAGGSTGLPPVTPQRASRFAAEGVTLESSSDTAYSISASPDYFHALGTAFLEGREFTSDDAASAPKVVIISEGLARRIYPDRSALGRHIRFVNADYSDEWRTIVGVVRTVRYAGLSEANQPAIYAPFAQVPMSWMYVMLRHNSENPALIQNVRAAISDADQALAPMAIQPMSTLMWGTVAQPRFRTELLCTFAAIALLLAAIGIHGVIAYAVSQRTKEIGVRIALGASRTRVVSLVLLQAMRLSGVAILIGIPVSLMSARVLHTLLFGVSEADVAVHLAAAILIMAVTATAAYIPARRASKLDAIRALRYE